MDAYPSFFSQAFVCPADIVRAGSDEGVQAATAGGEAMQAVMTQKITERAPSVNPRSKIARRADSALLALAHLDYKETTRRVFKVIPGTHGCGEYVEQEMLVDYLPINTPVDTFGEYYVA